MERNAERRRVQAEREAETARVRTALEEREGECQAESVEELAPMLRSISGHLGIDYVIDSIGFVRVVDHEFIIGSQATQIRPRIPGEYTVVVQALNPMDLEVRDSRGAVRGQRSDTGMMATEHLVFGHGDHRTFMANGRDTYEVDAQSRGCAVLILLR